MTLTKNKMVREIGRRTRLKNRQVQMMLEALVEVWMEELVSDGRIELENFFVLEAQRIDRGENAGALTGGNAPRYVRRVVVRGNARGNDPNVPASVPGPVKRDPTIRPIRPPAAAGNRRLVRAMTRALASLLEAR